MDFSGSVTVSWSFSNKDECVLLVGKQQNGHIYVINEFQGAEAREIFDKLTTRKEKQNKMKLTFEVECTDNGLTNFTLAEFVYNLCKSDDRLDAYTVASMMQDQVYNDRRRNDRDYDTKEVTPE